MLRTERRVDVGDVELSIAEAPPTATFLDHIFGTWSEANSSVPGLGSSPEATAADQALRSRGWNRC
jgi:hypothetical protein